MTSFFAHDFNASEIGYAAGLLHDLGKYSTEFQMRLEGSNVRVDHSTAGAREARAHYPIQHSRFLEYIIAGHHCGLSNFGSSESGLEQRLSKAIIPAYSSYVNEIVFPDIDKVSPIYIPAKERAGYAISFYIRMLYSCLVDADSLDTERFYSPMKEKIRDNFESFEVLISKFDDHMSSILSKVEDNKINQYRKQIYVQCKEKASMPPHVFTLTVPTGGGKTLASMAFALKHLKANNLKRIIYVIPYTSIIEQNAAIFRKIFGNKNVLEHHSNFDPDSIDFDDIDVEKEALRLATDNWDMPIIITTNVQFFESLFSSRRSRCRKLHNLTKSVIILDEAQMLPTGFMKPCLAALSELINNYGCSVVLCTATQPKLAGLLDASITPKEIMHSSEELYEAFRRVRVNNLGELRDVELSTLLKAHRQVLCILNTRKHAKNLYDDLAAVGNCYHLSARMCPVHRRKQLATINECLKNDDVCRVISTQLIEAGVDIDFPVVYRAMAGIDSIAQAAGRCNREGKLKSGIVNIFKSAEIYGKATSWQRRTAEIGEMIAANSKDPLSLSSVATYFQRLYFFEGEDGLDKNGIMQAIEERRGELAFSFQEINDTFNIIEKDAKDIIIPYDDRAVSMIKRLRNTDQSWPVARQLQGYTISIYADEFDQLSHNYMIDTIDDRFYVLNNEEIYSEDTGLTAGKYNGIEKSLQII